MVAVRTLCRCFCAAMVLVALSSQVVLIWSRDKEVPLIFRDSSPAATALAATRAPESVRVASPLSSSLSLEKLPAAQWRKLDGIVDEHTTSAPSGGIFLYRLQASLLMQLLQQLAMSLDGKLRVCETGFGAGHSAALWLASDPRITVTSFDFFDKPYQLEAVRVLQQLYPGRLEIVRGNTCHTVPLFQKRCDVLHGSSLCPSDAVDLVLRQPCGAVLTASAMDTLHTDVYFSKRGSWSALDSKGCIREVNCFRGTPSQLQKDFIFAGKSSVVQEYFCFAITSGKCIYWADRAQAHPGTFQLGDKRISIDEESATRCRDGALYSTSFASLRRVISSIPSAFSLNWDERVVAPLPVLEMLPRLLSHSFEGTVVNAAFEESAGAVVQTMALAAGQAVLKFSGDNIYNIDAGCEHFIGSPAKQWVIFLHISTEPGKEILALHGAASLLADGTVTYSLLRFEGDISIEARLNQVRAVTYLTELGYKVMLLASTVDVGFGPNHAFNSTTSTELFQRLALAHPHGTAFLFATMGRDLAIPSVSPFIRHAHALHDEQAPIEAYFVTSDICRDARAAAVVNDAPEFSAWESRNRSSDLRVQRNSSQPAWLLAGSLLKNFSHEVDAVCLYPSGDIWSRVCRTQFQRPSRWQSLRCHRKLLQRVDGMIVGPGDLCLTLPATVFPTAAGGKAAVVFQDCDGTLSQQWYVSFRAVRHVRYHGRLVRAREHWGYEMLNFSDFYDASGHVDSHVGNCSILSNWQPPRPSSVQKRRNILLLVLDAVSRPQALRMLPRTIGLLQRSGFADFDRYAVVGANSGPNQVALYTGAKLHGRAVSNISHEFLWDLLREVGYVTLKIEDDCVRNSNMLKSVKPRSTFGAQHDALQCLLGDPAEPAWCNGLQSKLGHTLRYALQFMNGGHREQFAAMVHVLAGHEDSMMYLHTVDGIIAQFLAEALEQDASIVVLSDHGLHYGSYESVPSGRVEHMQPFLFVRSRSQAEQRRLHANRHVLATPFDVHATLAEWAGLRREALAEPRGRLRSSLGSPFLSAQKRTCDTIGIPATFCLYPASSGPRRRGSRIQYCTDPGPFPSMNSFYASLVEPQALHDNVKSMTFGFLPPSSARAKVPRSPVRSRPSRPDIVILEIDSLSKDHAIRMLPRLHAQLARDWGAVVFDSLNSVGFKSIENQMAMYSGCYAIPREVAAQVRGSAPPHINLTLSAGPTLYNPRGYARLCANTTGAGEWMWDALRSINYSTMHAEEFCSQRYKYWSLSAFYDSQRAWDRSYGRQFCDRTERTMTSKDLYADVVDFIQSGTSENPRFVFAEFLYRHKYIYSPIDYARDGNVRGEEEHLLRAVTALLDGAMQRMRPLILVLIGDHGISQGLSSLEWAHQAEYRNPSLVIAWSHGALHELQAVTLRANSARLVTHFDIYKTILGFADPRGARNGTLHWAIALQQRQVPLKRTCRFAGIPSDFCNCLQLTGVEHKTGRAECDHPLAPRLRHCNWWAHPVERCCKSL